KFLKILRPSLHSRSLYLPHRKPSPRKSNDTMIDATTLIVSSLCKALIMTAPQLSTRAEYMIGGQGMVCSGKWHIFTAAFPRTVFGKQDRCAKDPRSDRALKVPA